MTKVLWILMAISVLGLVIIGRDLVLAFVNVPSLLITLGGTFGVTCFTYSRDVLKETGRAVRTVLSDTSNTPHEQLATIAQLAQLNRLGGLRALENHEESISDPVLRRGIHLIVDMQREDEVRASIEHEFFRFANQYESARQVLLTMGKLLPSFGMVGTLSGLVLLLRQATDPDPHTLAPALAVAVLTTLYGAVFANALVLPLAARIQAFIQKREISLRLILEGVILLARNESPALIKQRLSTLLAPSAGEKADGRKAANGNLRLAWSRLR